MKKPQPRFFNTRLWFKIIIVEQRRVEEVMQTDSEALTDDPDVRCQRTFILTVGDVIDTAFTKTTVLVQLVSGHVMLFQKLTDTQTYGFAQLHILLPPSAAEDAIVISPFLCTNYSHILVFLRQMSGLMLNFVV